MTEDEVIETKEPVDEPTESPKEWTWDLSQPKTEPEAPLTRAELTAMIKEAMTEQQTASPDMFEELKQQAVAQAKAEMAADMDQVKAAVLMPSIRDVLCEGLGPAAKAHMTQYLGKYNATGLRGLASDADAMEALRALAEKKDVGAKKAAAPPPKSEDSGTPGKPLTGKAMRDADAAFQAMKGVPGASLDKFKKFFQESEISG